MPGLDNLIALLLAVLFLYVHAVTDAQRDGFKDRKYTPSVMETDWQDYWHLVKHIARAAMLLCGAAVMYNVLLGGWWMIFVQVVLAAPVVVLLKKWVWNAWYYVKKPRFLFWDTSWHPKSTSKFWGWHN